MKTQSHSLAFVLLLLQLPLGATEPDSAQVLQASALLHLDLGGIPPSDLSSRNLPVELADAELHLGLRFHPEVQAKVVLLADQGEARFDQAWGVWTRGDWAVDFGQETLPLGLYAGGLIHDPLLQQDLEIVAPTLGAGWARCGWGVHLAAAQVPWATDTLEGSFPAGQASVDRSWGEGGLLRLSGLLAHESRIAGAAARIPVGGLVLDLEAFGAEGRRATADWGGLAGLLWSPVPSVDLGTRYDVRSPVAGSGKLEEAVAAGVVWRFAPSLLAGIEWFQDLDGAGVLTFRIGLDAGLSVR